jgi:hypothetical protein
MNSHPAPVRYPPAGYRDYTLIGPPRHVLNVIANHRAAGTLIAVHTLSPISVDDPIVRVRLRLHDTPPTPARPLTPVASLAPRRLRRITTVILATAAPVLGVVLAVAYLIGRLVEWITAHASGPAGLTAVAVLIAAGLRGTRRRRHCPGC